MQKYIFRTCLAFIGILFITLPGISQSFNGGGGAVPGSSTTPTCFNINVTGVGVINTSGVGLASVCMSITHPDVGDLEITLTAPDGTMVPLSIQNGGNGNNYTNTCFTATASGSIKFANPPYTGNFLPEGWLGAVNNGQNANGNWRLCVRDRRNPGSSGSVQNWSITFNNTPAPMPPPMPTCANTLPTNSSCSNATLVCDFNGQCGTTSGNSIQDWPGSGLDGDCFGLNNNSFIRFVASATTATFSVWVPTTAQTNQQGGVQMLFFSGTCNSGPVTVHGCYPRILPYSSSGQPLVSVVTANNLIPGNTYYLMIDGANGDITTFTIAANTGVNVLNINPAAPDICEGQSVNLTASGGNGTYSWSPATNLSATSGATVTANPASTTTYTVTSTTPTGCPLTKDVTVTVNPVPAAPVAEVTAQPNCTVTSGSINVTSPIGAGLQYSINGGVYQSSPNFTGLTPGNYTITVQNAASCISPASALITINDLPPTPERPTASATQQPSCLLTTGTITVTAPLGAGLMYSIGGPFQTSPVFTGLTQNVYNVVVQNAPGCISQGTSVTINAAPSLPTAPDISVIQPTCTSPTGTITITSPVGSQYVYRIIPGDPVAQSSPVFSNLAPDNYVVVAALNGFTDCFTVSNTTINAIPSAPASPIGTILQPGCPSPVNPSPTGSIFITAPVGAGLQYSINGGPYQVSPAFGGLTPGSYTVTVQNAEGCVSLPSEAFVINSIPINIPTINLVQPAPCGNSGATVTVTSPLGSSYSYALLNTVTNIQGPGQISPVFNNVAPGTYRLLAQYQISNCIVPSEPFTVNAAIPAPVAPTVTLIQPTCLAPTGTIIITDPTGTGLEYSINGTNYQTSSTFNNVAQGNYNVTVRNTTTSCTSSATAVIINTAPTFPTLPTGAVTIQPDCNNPTGQITITSPVGTNYEYAINSGAFQPSPVFNNLTADTYSIVVRNIVSGCTSPSLSLTVNNGPLRPDAPTLNVSIPTCTTPDAVINITAPLGAQYQYSLNGGTFTSTPNFSVFVEGVYEVTVRDQSTGCTSLASSTNIVFGPTTPATPVITQVQPSCPLLTGTITVDSPIGSNIEYSINGINYQTSNFFNNVAGGNYNVTARFVGTTCISSPTPVTILGLTPEQCQQPVAGDIYFPNAFTPNGDGLNDGFGPGPRSSLAAVTQYRLLVYNRYGEMVFSSNDPAVQWNGMYKGKMLGNNSYTWVAQCSFNGRPLVTQKGSVILIR